MSGGGSRATMTPRAARRPTRYVLINALLQFHSDSFLFSTTNFKIHGCIFSKILIFKIVHVTMFSLLIKYACLDYR